MKTNNSKLISLSKPCPSVSVNTLITYREWTAASSCWLH